MYIHPRENMFIDHSNPYKLMMGSSVDVGDDTIKSETCMSTMNEDLLSTQGIPLTAGNSSFMNCVGIGFPLITFNFNVNKMFLKKHKLTLDCIYTMTSSREILVDSLQCYGHQLKDYPIDAGGSTLDIGQMAQYLQPQSKTVVFLGARAIDEDSLTLIDLCRAMRVGIRMEEVKNGRTSILLVLHIKKRWCEIYFTDQLVRLSSSFIDRPAITKLLERTSIIYTSELSILLMPKVSKMIAYFCFSRFKNFITVLHNSECLVDGKESLLNVLSYTDILFLTPQSARKFSEVFHVPRKHSCCTKNRRAWDIFLWLKGISQKSCTVIVSDGLRKAYVHTDLCLSTPSKYTSTYIKQSEIVDYYGVSRAFVGGFMAMLIGGFQVDPCVECGFFCASLIARKVGMTLPEDREEILHKWYTRLETLMHAKCNEYELGKRESNLPFTVFQTPWKELEVNDVYGESFSRGIEKC